MIDLHGRFQYDRADSALGVRREFYSAGVSASSRLHAYLVLDGGVTWRWGKTSGAVAQDETFSDAIFHVGVALTY